MSNWDDHSFKWEHQRKTLSYSLCTAEQKVVLCWVKISMPQKIIIYDLEGAI